MCPPETAPNPRDSYYLFEKFAEMIAAAKGGK
jgi:carbamoylphosphate synthase small subunit